MSAARTLGRRLCLPLGKRVANILIALGWHRLLAWWMSGAVRERLADGSAVRFRRDDRAGRPIVLVLQADRMPHDMRVLAQGDDIRVLELNEPWLARIAFHFLPPGRGFSHYVVREPREDVRAGREQLRTFLQEFLPHFYRLVPASCTVRSDIKLPTDFDWAAVSEQLGIRHIVIQRENAYSVSRLASFAPRDATFLFEGSHIITFNEPTRQHYIGIGIAKPAQISALGCLRMDTLVAGIRKLQPRRRCERVTLFAFEPEGIVHVGGPEILSMCRDVYLAVFEFARRHPEVSVVIKLKRQQKKKRTRPIVNILQLEDIFEKEFAKLPNLLFTAEGNAQDHIFNSDVVIGINSSTVVEAAVAGRPVIVPFFESMRVPKYLHQIDFSDQLDMFDAPRDQAEFLSMLERRLHDLSVDDATMERRWQAFDKGVGSRDGQVRERIVAKLLEVIAGEQPREALRRVG